MLITNVVLCPSPLLLLFPRLYDKYTTDNFDKYTTDNFDQRFALMLWPPNLHRMYLDED